MNPYTLILGSVLIAALGVSVGVAAARRDRPGAPPVGDDALLDAVRVASNQAMREQSEQFLRLAETRYGALEHAAEERWRVQGRSLVDQLDRYAEHLGALEQQRHREAAVLSQAVGDLRRSNQELRDEARGLAAALTDSSVRGSWGEMQLRRVLEHAGMVAHADFVEQRGVAGADTAGRPDVVVHLPNDRRVVIDAKAPLDAFLRAADATDPAARAAYRAEHARAVAGHVTALARRRYDELVEGAVDFVVMFIPGDGFLSAAFEARPELLEEAARQNVILASPSTLLAFLRGVACGWRERQVADEAAEIARLGRELHERVAVFSDHFAGVGVALGRAVGTYNQALGSMERRLLVTARKFEEHGAGSGRELGVPSTIDDLPGSAGAPELAHQPSSVQPSCDTGSTCKVA